MNGISYRKVSHEEREVAYCENCNKFTPWHTAIALGNRCICGSTEISRGTTGVFDKIVSSENYKSCRRMAA